MEFYDSIARYYELIFPTSPDQERFVRDQVDPGSRILDVACGTGALARGLARAGYDLVGYDLDRTMVIRAVELARAEGLEIPYSVWDMRQLPEPPQPFDALLCVGNSLVHLTDDRAIDTALAGFNRQLSVGGKVIIQIINYDRILDQKVDSLPTINDETHGLTFERFYDQRDDGLIDFRTSLSLLVGSGREVIRNTIALKPLRKLALTEALSRAGFMVEAVCGGFNAKPWEPSSYATVFVAAKQQSS
ncbi:MAG: class I SAM-dependent methyltransferase [Bacillota bacterium]